MKDDMTYNEIEQVKLYVSQFIFTLQSYAKQNGILLNQSDMGFFTLISKHILFFKYMYQDNRMGRFYKVLISDCYYYILSIIKGESRYMYVNERSIIENYLRLIINKTVEQDHITEKVFQEVKKQSFLFDFTEADFSLLKSEYVTACGYIHGSKVIDDDLSFVFCECIKTDNEFKDKNKYYIRIQKILKIFDNMLLSTYKDDVSGAFHRRKSLLEYLIGKNCVNLLFTR